MLYERTIRKPFHRFNWFVNINLTEPSYIDKYMHKYSHRWNLQPLCFLFFFGTVAGCVGYYINHKIYHIEKHSIRDYGADYPQVENFWIFRKLHYHRIASFHFQKYKFFYYIDEQAIDPLNK